MKIVNVKLGIYVADSFSSKRAVMSTDFEAAFKNFFISDDNFYRQLQFAKVSHQLEMAQHKLTENKIQKIEQQQLAQARKLKNKTFREGQDAIQQAKQESLELKLTDAKTEVSRLENAAASSAADLEAHTKEDNEQKAERELLNRYLTFAREEVIRLETAATLSAAAFKISSDISLEVTERLQGEIEQLTINASKQQEILRGFEQEVFVLTQLSERAKNEAAVVAAAAAAEVVAAESAAAAEVVAAKSSAVNKAREAAEAALTGNSEDLSILIKCKDFVSRTEVHTNDDAKLFTENFRGYYETKVKKVQDPNVTFTGKVSPGNLKLFKRVYDMIVQKKGNVRTVLRFNNMGSKIQNYGTMNAFFAQQDKIKSSNWFGLNVVVKEEVVLDVNDMWKITDSSVAHTQMFARWLNLTEIRNNGGSPYNTGKLQAESLPTTIEHKELIFERIFTMESQEAVYAGVKPFIVSALDGHHVAVVAYGGTGSGKTYTMGTETLAPLEGVTALKDERQGIFARLIDDLTEARIQFTIQVVEVIPSFPTNARHIEHRVIDLVEAYLNIMKNEKKKFFYTPLQKGTVVKNDGTPFNYCMHDKRKFKDSLYKAENGLTDCVQSEIFKKELPGRLQVIKGLADGRTSADIKQDYFGAVKLRKVSDELGNSNSSRTHLLTTIQLTEKKNNIYMLDLAGKESLTEAPLDNQKLSPEERKIIQASNELTKGINESLKYLISLIKKKKVHGKIILNESGTKQITTSMKNPLETLMAPLWMTDTSKIMVLACGYPFASQNDRPFNLANYRKNKNLDDGWKTYFDIKEDSIVKLARDCIVYTELSELQKTPALPLNNIVQ
jgi:hypothetical protein